MADIFISYSAEDEDVTGALATALEAAGYSTWYYARDSDVAGDYLMEIGDELSRCRAVAFVISDHALASSEVYSELVEAHRLGRVMVPILRGITHEQLRQRSAKWAIALGGAVGVQLPLAGWDLEALAARIVKGLRKQGVEPIGNVIWTPHPPVHRQLSPRVSETQARAGDDTRLDQPGTRPGETATGPDGGVYVWVPPGEFSMGSKDIAPPVHHVRITKGFWLGKCTVTLAQWKAYCQTARITADATAPGDSHPITNVSWDDAQAYCRMYGLSLPKEAQWEYAARGREGREYPWGNEWDSKKCCNGENRGPGGGTFPVGSFPEGASWCGALDMAGNVWEWCADWYDREYYAKSPKTDPPGPGSGLYRSLRGGSWNHSAFDCRCSARLYHILVPSSRDYSCGFRACRML